MFRTVLMRGASAGAMTLVVFTSAQAQVGLPPIHISAHRVTSANAAGNSQAVQAPHAPQASASSQSDEPAPPPAADRSEVTQEALTVDQKQIRRELPPTEDTARLIRDVPGVSSYSAGAVSNLPAIHGMADDRINILVGGVQTTSACANHMNPPLSYLGPSNVESIEVYSGVMPVSRGGDAIGGTIIAEPKMPVFAPETSGALPSRERAAGLSRFPITALPQPGEIRFGENGAVLATGSVSSYFKGNYNGYSTNGQANVATRNWSILYNGDYQRGNDFHAGGRGDKVLSTNFIAENHSATLAFKNNNQYLSLRGAYQNIPYQGFANQRMDMTKNQNYQFEGRFKGNLDTGAVDAKVYWNNVNHEMGFLQDKQPADMPMATVGTDFGYSAKHETEFHKFARKETLRLGSEFHGFLLNDWWEPVVASWKPGTTMNMGMMRAYMPAMNMMGPQAFWNINNGRRNRLAHYAEWDAEWSDEWSSLVGVRNDTVWLSTGNVQPYNWQNPVPMTVCPINMMGVMQPCAPSATMGMANPDAVAARNFNAQNRARTNINFDMTAMMRYQPNNMSKYEFGYSRKTRSPNLYELYAWAPGSMAASMNNWFGDANGYVGNLNLQPEVAHTVGLTAMYKDPKDGVWEARVNPYYSYIENYIDAARWNNFATPSTLANGLPSTYVFQTLQFQNYKAYIYGADLSGRYKVYDNPDYGRVDASIVASYTYGQNMEMGQTQNCPYYNTGCYAIANTFLKGHTGLYHIMPFNTRLGLEHRLGGWFGGADLQIVAGKDVVSVPRNEQITNGYTLVNLRAGYEWTNLRFDLGVQNLANTLYSQPLGGFYFSGYKASGIASAMPGMGRNVYVGVNAKF